MWNQGVVSAVRTQKQQSMCCGPALLLETYGHYVGGKLQKCSNAATDFFSLFWLLVDKIGVRATGEVGYGELGVMDCKK